MDVTPVAFTGTRNGWTFLQGRTMFDWLNYLRARLKRIELHHGDCVGSDAAVHRQCRALGIPRVIHPPDDSKLRAFANKDDGKGYELSKSNWTKVLDPVPYLDRNRAMVHIAPILLATPEDYPEEQRSGTWSTIREARRKRIWIIRVHHDGVWVDEGPRPAWCGIPDDEHIWDGDSCIACGFGFPDVQAYKNESEWPTCREWRTSGTHG